MASSLDYVNYVCDQIKGSGEITFKKMFGEYTLYCEGKVVGLICDNQVFIKPTPAGDALLPDAKRLPPYPGAKEYLLLEDLDDRELLTKLISSTSLALPMPKPKKKKVPKPE